MHADAPSRDRVQLHPPNQDAPHRGTRSNYFQAPTRQQGLYRRRIEVSDVFTAAEMERRDVSIQKEEFPNALNMGTVPNK